MQLDSHQPRAMPATFCFKSVAVLVFLATAVVGIDGQARNQTVQAPWRVHTLFSVECDNYFDWQTVGLMHSYRKSGHVGPITRLLSCTPEKLKEYRGMDLAPTHVVPSMSRHPVTGDWYPAINKPAGVVYWLNHSEEAKNVDWVVILDADMIIRGSIVPWELGAEKGKPVSASYGYLIGCDNELAKLHTKHPENCDKVGGLIAMHIDDLRAMAPFWLSKTEEVREDRAHWATNITGDIYGQGWISEMYGYSFGAAEVGLHHKINDNVMIYPGYIPRPGFEPLLLHYGLEFKVGNWSFSKANYHTDDIVYDCNRLFPAPPFPKEVKMMESDPNILRGLMLSLECINTINEGLIIHHQGHGCSKAPRSKYLAFLKANIRRSKASETLAKQVMDTEDQAITDEQSEMTQQIATPALKSSYPKIHTLFSAECTTYFDWQTVGLVHSFKLSGQPGYITRLLSCTEEELRNYKGMDLAPTHVVPSMNLHPLTGDWYPAINKPAAVLHWLNHVNTDVDFVVILDADMVMRGSITPWEFGAERGHPVSAPYDYLIGCDNELAQLHTRHPESCDKVGGVIIMHIEDLRRFAPLWLYKTEEVRADKAHWATEITGDQSKQGWISEMYGYSFGAAELNLRHRIRDDIMLYPGYIPPDGIEPRVLHYGLEFKVGDWSFDKANWRMTDMTNICWRFFPEPPDTSTLTTADMGELRRDQISIECINTINEALYIHHQAHGCPEQQANISIYSKEERRNPVLQKKEIPEEELLQEKLEEQDNDLTLPTKQESLAEELEDESDGRANSTGLDLYDYFNVTENGYLVTKDTKQDPFLSRRTVLENFQFFSLISLSSKYWMVAVWTLLVCGFLLIISSLYSRHRRNRQAHKGKAWKVQASVGLEGQASSSSLNGKV